MKRFDKFKEKYKYINNIETNYDIIDHKDLKLESTWTYTTQNIAPHHNAIRQEKMISCEDDIEAPKSECTATQLQVKYKIIYDMKIKITFKSVELSNGWAGVLFRKKDDFNYYALDINKSWIRFRKMENGKQSIIKTEK